MARSRLDATWHILVAAWLMTCVILTAVGPAFAQADTAAPAAAPSETAAPAAAPSETAAPAAAPSETAAPDAAASETAPAAALANADLERLLKTLEDDAERTKFVATLKDIIAVRQAAEAGEAEPAVAKILDTLSDQVDRASQFVVAMAALTADLPNQVLGAIDEIQDPRKRDRWLEVIVKLAIVLGAAFAVEWAVRAALSRPRRKLEARQPEYLTLRLAHLVMLTLLRLVPVLAFAAAASVVLTLIEPKVVTRLVAIALINASVLGRLIMLVMDFLLVPSAPSLRLHGMSDGIATGLSRWSWQLTKVGVYGYFGLQAALLLGMNRGLYLLLLQVLGLAIAVMLAVMVIKYRAPVAAVIRGSQSSASGTFEVWSILRRRIAEVWHLLAVIYIIAVYLVWTLGVSGNLLFMVKGTVLSVVIIVVASITAIAASHLIEVALTKPQAQPGEEAAPSEAHPSPRHLGLIYPLVDLLVYTGAILALLSVWGADVTGMLTSDTGRRAISSAVTILVVVGVSLLIFETVSRSVQRYLSAKDDEGQTVERSARARTLLPLAHKALVGLLFIMTTFIILSEVGVDITPLIAGAGVFGIAIGFGAQSLVRDVISGFFILMEDTFVVGDVVDIGGNAGVVEAISIRTVKLRDLTGTVHTIPFGDVTRIKNLTKDFSYYLLDVGVAYREDVDEVMQVLRDLGAELQEDVAFKFSILEPIEILGVDAFADSAVIIKARIKTRPIRQWAVGREFNRRMKNRFDELGIEIPFPHQTVYFGVDKQGDAPPANLRVRAPAGSHRSPAPPAAAEAPPTIAAEPPPQTMSDPPASATLAAVAKRRSDRDIA